MHKYVGFKKCLSIYFSCQHDLVHRHKGFWRAKSGGKLDLVHMHVGFNGILLIGRDNYCGFCAQTYGFYELQAW